MSSSPPTTLGKYQIIREIARSNDIVYEAYDPLMNRRVALKELAIPGGSTQQQKEDRIRRFQREVKAAGSLSHPNIVTIYEVGEEAGRNFMAMEFLDGHTLRNELDTRGFLEQDRALEIAGEVLNALDFAHSHGVIHRDIKPENIQILENGRIKITDFGIARLTFEPNLTMDGQVFGTPSYMSPEQVVGKEIDVRSDLFSIGVVLYEMIAGKKPFGGDSVVSITYAIMNLEPEQPTQASYPLWETIRRALDKSPGMRYSTAKEMLEVLKELRGQLNSSVVLPNPPPVVAPSGVPYQYPGGTMLPPAAPPTYAYNPYQPQPPHPYGTQQPYPGQAYGAQPYGVQPYAAQPYPQGLPQVPVYYPPPPREPLIKPETKRFLGRLFLTVIIVGTFFVLLLVGINSIATAMERYSQQREDAAIRREIASQDPQVSVDERIAQTEQKVPQLKNDVSRSEEIQRLAVLYEQQGKKRMQSNDLTGAEESFRKALESDPESSALYSNLGELFGRYAVSLEDPAQQEELWSKSADYWKEAERLERNGKQKQMFRQGVAAALYNMAGVQSLTDKSKARATLFEARNYAPAGSSIDHAIESALAEILR